jgi:tetratricopeptide (TPR) repeat protein
MPVKTKKIVQSTNPLPNNIPLIAKIISGILFFIGAFACIFTLIAYVRANDGSLTDLLIPLGLLLVGGLVALQLYRRNKGFVIILVAISVLGGLGGWGYRAYHDFTEKQKVIVLVLKFDGEEAQNAIREKVLADIRTASKDLPNVEIQVSDELVTRAQGSLYARQLGENADADIVVWSWYQAKVAPVASIFVEDVTPAALTLGPQKDATQPQPILAYLTAFEVRRNFDSKTDTFITFMSAMLNYKNGNYQKFLDLSKQVLSKKDSTNYIVPYDLNFYIGVSHSIRGELDLALESYNNAIKYDRKGPASYNNRALVYIEQQQYDLAIKDCTTAWMVERQYSLAFNTRGIAYLKLGQYENAIKDFYDVILLDPNDPRGYHNRALAYQGLGKTDLAAADLKKEDELRSNP